MTMTFDSGFRFRRLILFLGSGLLGYFRLETLLLAA